MNSGPSPLHGPLRRLLGASGHAVLMRAWRRLEYERLRLRGATGWWLRARRAPRVSFTPERPTRHHVVYACCARAGYALRTQPRRDDALVVAFSTETSWSPDQSLLALARHRRVLNLGCTDITKTRVNEVFARSFGRPLAVDPTTHVGPAVEKSDLNAVHDGRIVNCPLTSPAPGAVYQRLIDNRTTDGRVVDIRVAIVDGTVPVTYHRYRPEDRRFRSGNERAELTDPTEVLDDAERAGLLRFAADMGLDLGEMDVLRDRDDGQIYVVDVNPTPWGPPSGIAREHVEPALTRYTDAVRSLGEHPWGRPR